MKPILLFFLVSCSITLFAQDYTNIASPGTTFFKHADSFLRGYRYDSAKVTGSDSVFYAPRVILRSPDPYGCSDTSNGPVLGMVIRKAADGWFIFLDRNTDSVKFKANALLNESWLCKTLPANGQLMAKITAIRTDSVVDTVDQVKEITFNAQYTNGTVYPHIINGVRILLSRHFGFVRTIDWNLFPNDTSMWALKGKGSPKIGIQDFTMAECYDFQPGDVFHYCKTEDYSGAIIPTKLIKTILSRTNYGNDSVVYVSSVCSVKTLCIPPPNIEQSWDTVTESIVFGGFNDTGLFNRIPDQFVYYTLYPHRATRYFKPEGGFNGRPSKGVSPGDYCFTANCWREYSFEDFYKERDYAKGLGTWFSRDYSYDSGSWQDFRSTLVYYQKGPEQWGTPLAQDCNLLMDDGLQPLRASAVIRINPNPVKTLTVIEMGADFHASRSCWQLYDMTGRLLKMGTLTGSTLVFDRSGIGAGCYIFSIKDEKGGRRRQAVMMAE